MSALLIRRRHSISVRIFLVNFLLSLCVLGAFSLWLLGEMCDLGTETAFEDAMATAAQVNHQIDGLAMAIKNTLFLITADDRLTDSASENRARELLANYGEVSASVFRGIYLALDDGRLSASRQVLADVLGAEEVRRLGARARDNPGRIITGSPYRSLLSGYTIAFAYRPSRNRLIEYPASAIAELDPLFLQARLTYPVADRKRSLVICDREGVPLAWDPASAVVPFIQGSFPPELDPIAIGRWLGANNYNGFIVDGSLRVVRSSSNEFGWNVFVLIERSEVEAAAKKLVAGLPIVFSAILLFLLAEAVLVSFSFSLPLRKLVREMDRIVALEDFRILPVKGKDELGALVTSYNALLRRMRSLVEGIGEAERAKGEYELKMLQSQIGPHFLYNTLACIGNLATQKRIPQVRTTIRALVDLLSFTFDKKSELVTLEEELHSVEAYAEIQRIRYGDIFELIIRVDAETRNFLLPKLTLQPLVENALFHGIIPKRDRGIIRIISQRKKDILCLWVGDNGVGMDDVKRASVLNPADHSDRSDSFNGRQSLNRIGILNVDRRLTARYGGMYGVRLFSKREIGTVVAIEIPNSH